MKDPARWTLTVLVFPIAPIVVIHVVMQLCRELWKASYYPPGEDGGEVEPAMAALVIPLLLLVVAAVLGTLTAVSRWLAARGYAPGWVRGLGALLRACLTLAALALFVLAAGFFMGDATDVLGHWQVALAWALVVASGAAFVFQQARRLLP